MTRVSEATTDLASEEVLAAAFPAGPDIPDAAQRLAIARRLHAHYTALLGAPETFRSMPRLGEDAEITALEQAWQAWEDAQVEAGSLPTTPREFHDWFLATARDHVQPDFCGYLASEATLAEIALFMVAEEMVDSRFDDLVAMAQIGTSGATKLTIAENYWEEMGEGNLDAMHTKLFEHSARFMREHTAAAGVDTSFLQVAEVYENANIALGYTIHRHLLPRALGALGLMEHSAPPRFQAMVDGCTRLGVPDDVVEYQRVHVHVDADHGNEWVEGVFTPLVSSSPDLLHEIAMGVAVRRRVANAYYNCVWGLMKEIRR